jgi:hypothetical protein
MFGISEGLNIAQYEMEPHNYVALKEVKKMMANKELVRMAS